MIKLLVIPGSLRPTSSSNQILQEIIAIIPGHVQVTRYNGIGTLPHFDDSQQAPESVLEFRKKIKDADAVLICTPEYAFGIPGSLKNAIDWTVGSGEFVGKPVGVVTASSQGDKGHAALILVLTAVSARVIGEACLVISSVRSKIDAAGMVNDPLLLQRLKEVTGILIRKIK